MRPHPNDEYWHDYDRDHALEETTVPSSWPDVADLCPIVVPRYPAVPNTDAIETVRPPAGGAS